MQISPALRLPTPFRVLALASLAHLATAGAADAADRFWTGASTDNTANTLWSTTNNIWGETAGEGGTAGAPDTQTFAPGDNAIFEGTAATVRLGSDITAGTITLGGYTINLDNNSAATTAGNQGFNLSATDIIGSGTITNGDSAAFKTFTWAPTTNYTGALTVSGRTTLVLNASSASTVANVNFANSQNYGSTNSVTVTQGVLTLTASPGTATGMNVTIAANGKVDLNGGKTFTYRTLSGAGEITNSDLVTQGILSARPSSSNFGGLITGRIQIQTADLASSTFTGAINNSTLNLSSTGRTSNNASNANFTFTNASQIGNVTLGNASGVGAGPVAAGSGSANRGFNLAFLNSTATVGTVALAASVDISAVAGSGNAGQSNTALVLGGDNSVAGNVTFTTAATSANNSNVYTGTSVGYAWLRLAGTGSTVGNVTMNGSYSIGTSGATQQTTNARLELLGSTGTIGNLVAATANPTNISKLVVLGNPGVAATAGDGSASTLTLNTTADSAFSGIITDGTVTATNATLSGITSNFVNQSTAATDSAAVGNLIKIGSATQTLSGANTYTGTTTINAGTLAVGLSGSIAGSTLVTVKDGASFDTTAQSFTMLGTQPFKFTLNPASSGTAGLLNAAALNISSGVVDFASLAPLDDDAYVIASYTSLAGATFAAVNNLPGGYTLDYNYLGGNDIALVIPEPSSLVMLLGGMGVLAFRRRPSRNGCGVRSTGEWRRERRRGAAVFRHAAR